MRAEALQQRTDDMDYQLPELRFVWPGLPDSSRALSITFPS